MRPLQERLAKAAVERMDRALFKPDSKRAHKEERVRPLAELLGTCAPRMQLTSAGQH